MPTGPSVPPRLVAARASPAAATDVARVALGDATFDALRAEHFTRPYPPHFHDTFAIGVVEEGATRISTRRGRWTAGPGAILAFAPGEIHAAEPLGEDGYAYRMLYPSAALMREIGFGTDASAGEARQFHTPVIRDRSVANELLRAHAPFMEHRGDGAHESALLAAIQRLVVRHTFAAAAPNVRIADQQVAERTREYMRRHFAEPVRLAAVADECGLSVFQLIRVFQRVVGVPPYAYLVQLRINRAQALLATGADVSDAAYACGFSDQSHLTRMFTRVLGVPPGRYVRQIRRSGH